MNYSEVLVDISAIVFILKVLDYIVTISFGCILYCVYFHLYCSSLKLFLMCGCVFVWVFLLCMFW